jgi:hypothetical protein
VEPPTLAVARSRNHVVDGETLVAAMSGGDGERRLAGGRDYVATSLGIDRSTLTSSVEPCRQRNPSNDGEPAGLGLCGGRNWVGWNPSPINTWLRVWLPGAELRICGHGRLVWVVGLDGPQTS